MRWLWRKLPQSRWKRFFAIVGLLFAAFVSLLVTLGLLLFMVSRSPRMQAWLMVKFIGAPQTFPDEPAATNRPPYRGFLPDARKLATAAELYNPTNVWPVHLHFTHDQWEKLGPNRVPAMESFLGPDGRPLLNNPLAPRNGLAGTLGLDFPKSQGNFDFGGVTFSNVTVRYKGNGTFMGSYKSYKRPFKIEFGKDRPGHGLAGRPVLNLANLVADPSALRDTLGFEFYRTAGVPASRTTFARTLLTIDGHFTNRVLGLHVSIENPDGAWAAEQFKGRPVTLFKPVTYELFADLGDDWKKYERSYDPKTKIEPPQEKRLIELARFVTQANDQEFATRLGEFFDLDEVARFFACEVLLSNYDGFFSNGQNFLMYLDIGPGRFGFIPWDLDQAWGAFTFIGTDDDRERADIWHPWVGEHRFLQRLYAAEPFRKIYRERLEQLLKEQFIPARLHERIDELAAVVRPALAEESAEKVKHFEEAVGDKWGDSTREKKPFWEEQPALPLKRFITVRAKNVRDQLDGKAEGVRLRRSK